VAAALDGSRLGISDNWIQHVRDTAEHHRESLSAVTDREAKLRKLCELHVVEQVRNLARTTIVRDAWARKQPLTLHGWIYGIEDGLLRNLNLDLSCESDTRHVTSKAFAAIEVREGEGILA
jgi:carbonic anhydrase